MAMTDLGLIGIANRGTYSASATYMKGNFVYYEGSTYLALLDNLTGVTPTPDMVNWQLLAAGSGDYSRSMTKAEFDVLTPQEKHGRIIVTDEDLHAATAAQIGYNDSVTGLGADDVQEAIAAVAGKIGDTDISGIGDGTVTGGISAINSNIKLTGVTGSESISSEAITSITSMSFSAGLYIITGQAQFSESGSSYGTGLRRIGISQTPSSLGGYNVGDARSANNASVTWLTAVLLVQVPAPTVYHLLAWHNYTGSALNVAGTLRAVQLKKL